MKVALYARVSTAEQTNENQLLDLRKYCDGHGHKIVATYEDTGSGGKANRKQLKQMLADAAAHKFELLLFWHLDRLTREGTFKALLYLNQLSEYEVAWKSLQQEYLDTSTPYGRIVVAVTAEIANMFLEDISQKTKAGLARARAKGKFGGRPRSLCQFDKEKVAQMRAEGLSYPAIARKFKVHPDTISRALKSPLLARLSSN